MTAHAQDTNNLKDKLSRVGSVSAQLIQESKNPEEAVAVAVALTEAAKEIYLQLGGPKLAEAEFRYIADSVAKSQHQ